MTEYVMPAAIPLNALADEAGMSARDLLALRDQDHTSVPSIFKSGGRFWVWRDESRAWIADLRRDRARHKLRPRR